MLLYSGITEAVERVEIFAHSGVSLVLMVHRLLGAPNFSKSSTALSV